MKTREEDKPLAIKFRQYCGLKGVQISNQSVQLVCDFFNDQTKSLIDSSKKYVLKDLELEVVEEPKFKQFYERGWDESIQEDKYQQALEQYNNALTPPEAYEKVEELQQEVEAKNKAYLIRVERCDNFADQLQESNRELERYKVRVEQLEKIGTNLINLINKVGFDVDLGAELEDFEQLISNNKTE
jgi:HD superfamily phosphohydrolase